ncbi:MAG: DUF1801 domain-containing protein [Phycisphaerae bacterium]|nr:DUF1801 domain-containing protein [Phycisphaerae bacterium]
MKSNSTTVESYLKSLPADRRAAIEAVRAVIIKNLDSDYEEGMQYGMIGYFVPHRVFPAGYHCDPSQPLCFAGLASQKNHMSLYLMCMYGDEREAAWLTSEWKKTGKKLDMGKSCIRFKKLDDLPLALVGEAVRHVPAKTYVARYVARLAEPAGGARASKKSATAAKPSKTTPAKNPAKKTIKKTVKKTASRSARN